MASNGKSTGDRLVGRFTETALLKRANEVVAEKSKASDIFDEEAEKSMPRFKKSGVYGVCLSLCNFANGHVSSQYTTL